MEELVYLALDAHARHCVIGGMDMKGKYLIERRFPTTESELVRNVVQVEAQKKLLAVEEGPLAFWISRTLREYVDEIFVCDPRENALISRNARKGDGPDVYNLCRLLRLGELKEVYHPEKDHRAIFKSVAQQYLDLRNQQKAIKQKIKAKYRSWGVIDVDGLRPYHKEHRSRFLELLTHDPIREQLLRFYRVLDATVEAQEQARRQMLRLGQRYAEIQELLKMPGVGPVGVHIFDAFIQTPDRFMTKQKLWRYCRLGIVDRTSDGKPLGYRKLDRAGNGELKAMSFRTFQAAMRKSEPNEVRQFYELSLERTHNHTHARLNTQRKILAVLLSIWKRRVAYRPELFLRSSQAIA